MACHIFKNITRYTFKCKININISTQQTQKKISLVSKLLPPLRRSMLRRSQKDSVTNRLGSPKRFFVDIPGIIRIDTTTAAVTYGYTYPHPHQFIDSNSSFSDGNPITGFHKYFILQVGSMFNMFIVQFGRCKQCSYSLAASVGFSERSRCFESCAGETSRYQIQV